MGIQPMTTLYVFLKGKEHVPNDVLNVLILMIHEELLTNPLAYKKRAVVMWLLPLAMQKMQSATDQVVYMMEDVLYGHKQ